MTPDIVTPATETGDIATGRWRIDPARSRVAFRTPTMWGLATVAGHFDRYEGTLDLSRTPAIELTIDPASLATGNRLRDRHLRSGHFFGVEVHPEVRFESDAVTVDRARLRVRGRLAATGTDVPVEIDVTLTPAVDGFELDAGAQVDHRAFGMSDGMLGMISRPSELIVQGRLVR